MPYRLRISSDEVRAELRKLGYEDVPDEDVQSFRHDLVKLIKHDLRKLKQAKENIPKAGRDDDFKPPWQPPHQMKNDWHDIPATSTPISPTTLKDSRQRSILRKNCFDEEQNEDESGYSESESHVTESEVSGLSSWSSHFKKAGGSTEREARLIEEPKKPTKDVLKRRQQGLGKEALPKYPKHTDPVSLYQFYSAHWKRFKIPGEEPHRALRWDVRTKLFYSK